MASSADSTARTSSPAVADAVRSARLVAVRARPTGDALAAAGLVARAARRMDTPFHLRATRQPTLSVDGTTLLLGYPDRVTPGVPGSDDDPDRPLRLSAGGESCTARVARSLRENGIEPAPVVTLAGQAAAGEEPTGTALETTDVSRRPGVGVPTDDLATGLAFTTQLRLPVSNDRTGAAELVETTTATDGTDGRRRLASVVALDATEAGTGTAAIQRVLHPHATDGPFESVEGYGDVLSGLAVADPSLGLAAATNPEPVADAALDAWQTHGQRVHRAMDDARTARYDGVFVCRVEDDRDTASLDAMGVLPSVARLAAAFRSPEPRTLVVGDGRAGAVGTSDAPVGPALRTAADAADGTAVGQIRGTAWFDNDVQAFVHGFREAVR